jgi:hypothetical protein
MKMSNDRLIWLCVASIINNGGGCLLGCSKIALMMEAARTSETLVFFYQTTRSYNREDSHLRTHRRENLKSYINNGIFRLNHNFQFYETDFMQPVSCVWTALGIIAFLVQSYTHDVILPCLIWGSFSLKQWDMRLKNLLSLWHLGLSYIAVW